MGSRSIKVQTILEGIHQDLSIGPGQKDPEAKKEPQAKKKLPKHLQPRKVETSKQSKTKTVLFDDQKQDHLKNF